MRLNIVGTSGAGKSFLAREISNVTGVLPVDLDKYFVNFEKTTLSDVVHNSKSHVLRQIKDFLVKDQWIMEGIFPINEVLEQADTIIFLKTRLVRSLYFQWKRYFTDSYQREKFGFVNNLGLSWIIMNQHLSKRSFYKMGDFEYITQHGWSNLLEKYSSKVVCVASENDWRNCLDGFSH